MIKTETRRLITTILLDSKINIPATVDYGVDSPQHLQALKEALSYYPDGNETKDEIEVELNKRFKEFEKSRCNGKAITAFVHKYAPRFKHLVFKTSWDELSF